MKRIVLLCLLLSGFGRISAARLDLTEAENGKDIVLRKGDALVVHLPGNPSTGYGWLLGVSKPGLLATPREGVYESVKAENRVGVPVNVVWKLKAVKAGSVKITFSYIRPWERNVPPARVVSWPVTIRP